MNRPFNRTLKSAPLVLLTLLLYACAGEAMAAPVTAVAAPTTRQPRQIRSARRHHVIALL